MSQTSFTQCFITRSVLLMKALINEIFYKIARKDPFVCF